MMWTAAGRVSRNVLETTFTLLLVRLLAPSDYGLMALATVFFGVLRLFLDMGISPGIVQRREIDDEYLSTAFWANLASGALLTLFAFLAGELFVAASRNPDVKLVVAVLSLRFLITGVTETQRILLIRQMRFNVIAIRNMVASIVGGIVAVAIAYRGYGVWSLVAQPLAGSLVGAVLLWQATKWRPRRIFSLTKFRELWHFGIRVFGSELFRYVVRRADIFLVGRYMGTALLGYYSLALTLIVVPLSEIASIVNQVALPALSRVQDEPASMRRGLLLTTRYSALFALPAIVGLAVLAPLAVLVVFGEKWVAAVPVIRVLTISSMMLTSTILWRTVLIGAGRPDLRFWWAVIDAGAYLAGYVIGLRWGIVGVAAGHLAATCVSFLIGFGYVQRIVHLTLPEYGRALLPVGASAAVMGAGLAFLQIGAPGLLPAGPAPRLGVLVVVGVVLYGSALWVIGRDTVLGMLRTVRMAVARVPA